MKKYKRIYVCHTFYHAYIACLKELNREKKEWGQATLLLSTMSNDFGSLKERVEKTSLFQKVLMFEEKEESFFPELQKLRQNKGNLFLNLIQRMIYTRKIGKLEEPYIPVNFREYEDIYVFCDSDPIGYYLNTHKIYYHAVEDGLDCIRYYDAARYDNRGHFALKAFLAARNLIFIQNGYSKYCIDMEVNDISTLQYPHPKHIEKPRKELTDHLSREQKVILTDIFIENKQEIEEDLHAQDQGAENHRILILTEPLCDLKTRKRIFDDIIAEYEKVDGEKATVILKPHPRDLLDYRKLYPDRIVLDGKFPMEILNFVDGLTFDKVIAVFTVTDAILFAKEKIYLGEDFMDRYEAPEIHRQNEFI